MEYVILLLSLVGIVFGADCLVAGSVSIARKFKVSDFVIGAAIIGVGTSTPEMTVSFIGALNGNADVAIGNVVGSNIFNIFGILGITAMFFPITFDRQNLKFEIPFCVGISVLLMFFALNFFNGTAQCIGRIDGIVLLACFAFFMWLSFSRDKNMRPAVAEAPAVPEESGAEDAGPMWKAVLKVIGGLAVLIFSCDLFVDNAVVIAKSFGVNDAFISLTLIACGTSLPELAASIAAALKKNTSMALGNVVGSNIFNIALILGLSSQVTPLTSTGITLVDYAVMIAAVVALYTFGRDCKIQRYEGLILFLCFIGYTWYLITNQIA
ncbi:MAG: calcium/sodium antiporter [Bacteroidales bacterium]|jgi:cation:H+ antiporter|nr:calcium/sodium antiporter [Bacteroidales bacterium]